MIDSMKKLMFIAVSLILVCPTLEAKDYRLLSPDGRTEVTVSVGQNINWRVTRDGVCIIQPSEMAVVLDDGTVLGAAPRVTSAKTLSVTSLSGLRSITSRRSVTVTINWS